MSGAWKTSFSSVEGIGEGVRREKRVVLLGRTLVLHLSFLCTMGQLAHYIVPYQLVNHLTTTLSYSMP